MNAPSPQGQQAEPLGAEPTAVLPPQAPAPSSAQQPTELQSAVALSVARFRLLASARTPRIAIILGSGWGGVVNDLVDAIAIDYRDLPAFPALGVGGHSGVLHVGHLGGVEVAVLAGRKHTYETGDAAAMKGAIQTLAALGVQVLLQTNAAGSLSAALQPGSVMLVADHVNMAQRTPLLGETGNARFVDMANAYDAELRRKAQAAASAQGLNLPEGVYAWVLGPQFETPAEIRMLQIVGATAVGMSTVPETILARHAGLRVLALSLITNMGCGLSSEVLSHAHTLAGAQAASERAQALCRLVVTAIAESTAPAV